MSDFTLLVTDDYGNRFFEIHEDGEIFDYTTNQVLKANFFDLDYSQMSQLSDSLYRLVINSSLLSWFIIVVLSDMNLSLVFSQRIS